MEFVITSSSGGTDGRDERVAWNFYCARSEPGHLALINIPFFMQFRNGACARLGHHPPHLLANIPTIIGEGRDVGCVMRLPALPERPVTKSDGLSSLRPSDRHLTLVFAAAGRQARRIKSASQSVSGAGHLISQNIPCLLHPSSLSSLLAKASSFCLSNLLLLPGMVGVTGDERTYGWT